MSVVELFLNWMRMQHKVDVKVWAKHYYFKLQIYFYFLVIPNNSNLVFKYSEEDKVTEEEETSNPLILRQILSEHPTLSQTILASDFLHQHSQLLLPVLLNLMQLFNSLLCKRTFRCFKNKLLWNLKRSRSC